MLERASIKTIESVNLNEIRRYKPKALLQAAEELGAELDGVRPRDIITAIIKKCIDLKKQIKVCGLLDIVNENYGFLRYSAENYASTSEDVFIPNAMIKKLNLKRGDMIECLIRLPANNEKYYTVSEILRVNDCDLAECRTRNDFECMTAVHPSRKIALELHDREPGNLSLRILDFMVPIGFGQRALIVAPPKTGKTTLMQHIAHAISINHPEVCLIVLLIGERPEEVTDMKRSVKGEVISSTFDESPIQHVYVADMALARAKRLAEQGRDVVVLMDSMTRFARSNNAALPSSGKVLTGGIDVNALQKPKQFFGAARDLEEGGSLTIIATTLVDTGSKADEVIHEEFKGTGNAEVVLDRKIAERRNFPAIDLHRSGTRKEELLLPDRTLSIIWLLRKILSTMGVVEATEFLINKVGKSRTNELFLRSLNANSEN